MIRLPSAERQYSDRKPTGLPGHHEAVNTKLGGPAQRVDKADCTVQTLWGTEALE